MLKNTAVRQETLSAETAFSEARWPLPPHDEKANLRISMFEKGWMPINDSPGCYVPQKRVSFHSPPESWPTEFIKEYLEVIQHLPVVDPKEIKKLQAILSSRENY